MTVSSHFDQILLTCTMLQSRMMKIREKSVIHQSLIIKQWTVVEQVYPVAIFSLKLDQKKYGIFKD